uniref:Uncharacterized protein n=1 Tax=Ciona intestinalis TaxID=7719 RepID=F6ZXX2_CIOIN
SFPINHHLPNTLTVTKLWLIPHTGERGHIIEKTHNSKTGDKEECQEFINLEEDEAEEFDQDWQQRSRSSAPHYRSHLSIGRHQPYNSHPTVLYTIILLIPAYSPCVVAYVKFTLLWSIKHPLKWPLLLRLRLCNVSSFDLNFRACLYIVLFISVRCHILHVFY